MEKFDQEAYESWVKKIESQITGKVSCPDCNGTGDGECPLCGHETECETCDGDGRVPVSQVLTRAFYLRVMAIEKAMLDEWIRGEPFHAKDERGLPNFREHPLNNLVKEIKPGSSPYSFSPVVLCLPLTEKS